VSRVFNPSRRHFSWPQDGCAAVGKRRMTALGEPPGPATHEVDHLATRMLEHHIERRLRSVHVLDRS